MLLPQCEGSGDMAWVAFGTLSLSPIVQQCRVCGQLVNVDEVGNAVAHVRPPLPYETGADNATGL
jgi:hypothetical protein